MEETILHLFQEFLEKQDLLSKLTESERLHEYGYSDIHVIDAIGALTDSNVTMIAERLKLTKGAVSKITKKLIHTGVIESYMIPENRQKVFFRLTESGKVIFDEHEKRHQQWLRRDRQFLALYSPQTLDEISDFMQAFNGYLEERISEFTNKE